VKTVVGEGCCTNSMAVSPCAGDAGVTDKVAALTGVEVASVAGAGSCTGTSTIDWTCCIEAVLSARGVLGTGGGVGRRPGPGFNGGGFHQPLGLEGERSN
jgi:hypothetical protein